MPDKSVNRCVRCTEELPEHWGNEPCLACSIDIKKTETMIALDEFLSKPNHEPGEWPIIPEEEFKELWRLIYEIIETKWGLDCDGDAPVQAILVNRNTHGPMHYGPVPNRGPYDDDFSLEACLRVTSRNQNIASRATELLLDGMVWREREKKVEEVTFNEAVAGLSETSEEDVQKLEDHIQGRRDASRVGRTVGWNADKENDTEKAGEGEKSETIRT